jgi:DNA polymerase-3 subunit alpha
MSQAAAHQEDIRTGQTSFFEVFDGDTIPEVEITDTHRWHENEMLVNEKEVLGFYFSGHPLARYSDEIAKLTSGPIKQVKELISSGTDVIMGGMVKHRKQIKTRSGGQMMVFMLEDLSDLIEAVIFPSTYTPEIAESIKEDAMIVVIGKLDANRGRLQCIVDNIIPLDEAKSRLVGRLVLSLNAVGMRNDEVQKIKKIIDKYPGDVTVEFEIKTKKYDKIKISTGTKARITDALLEELWGAVGKGAVSLVGRVPNVAVDY